MNKTRFRRDLRCTIADFSNGRLPLYELDKFETPEGTLGITLYPAVQIGNSPNHISSRSVNVFWFCIHLEERGWLVKECYTLPNREYVYLVVRKIDESDIEEKRKK